MIHYRIVFAGSSKKDIDKLDRVTRQRIAKKLQYFLGQEDPLVYARQLVHFNIGSYRFRVGHYRIVFDIDGQTLQVLSIKHRKDVYRG
jgi:mRNA interferase RelE/StbE